MPGCSPAKFKVICSMWLPNQCTGLAASATPAFVFPCCARGAGWLRSPGRHAVRASCYVSPVVCLSSILCNAQDILGVNDRHCSEMEVLLHHAPLSLPALLRVLCQPSFVGTSALSLLLNTHFTFQVQNVLTTPPLAA